MKTLKSLIFCLIVILGVSSFAKAAPLSQAPSILYVMEGKNGDCSGWGDVACELQTALFNATVGDQIWVAAGSYKPSSSTRTATFQLESGVAIYGGFPTDGGVWAARNWVANLTTLSGDIGTIGDNTDNSYHVVTGDGVDVTAVLNGFTISGGNANVHLSHYFSGGGMYNDPGSPTLTNVTFSGNSATDYGGGMYNTNASNPELTNVTFSANPATNYGGGMYNLNGSNPKLTNVTFTGNSAGYGGGMYNLDGSNPTLTNVIVWGNTPTLQIYNDGSSTPIITYSDIQGGGYPDSNNIITDPLLGSLANNGGFTQTHALGYGSPAIDAGNPNNCPPTDQRGYPRPIDGDGNGSAICDMGAYEYEFSKTYLPLIMR